MHFYVLGQVSVLEFQIECIFTTSDPNKLKLSAGFIEF